MATPKEEAAVPEMCAKLNRELGNIPWNVLEYIMITTPHVWIPMWGRCFETWFKRILETVCIYAESVGGDDMVDMTITINGKKSTL